MAKAKARYRISAEKDPRNRSVIRSFTGDLTRIGDKLKASFLAIGTFLGARQLLRVAEDAAAAGREVELMSLRFSISQQRFQEFRTTAKAFGVDMQQFNSLFQRFVRRTEEAAGGNKLIADEFERFHITLEDIDQLDPEALFLKFADGVAQTTNKTEALQRVIKILDVEGGKLFNTLNLGSVGIQDFGRRASRLGAVVDQDTNTALSGIAERLSLLGDIGEAEANRLIGFYGGPLTDALDGVLDRIEQLQQPSAGAEFEDETLGIEATIESTRELNRQLETLAEERALLQESLALANSQALELRERAGGQITGGGPGRGDFAVEASRARIAELTAAIRSNELRERTVRGVLTSTLGVLERANDVLNRDVQRARVTEGDLSGGGTLGPTLDQINEAFAPGSQQRTLDELNAAGKRSASTLDQLRTEANTNAQQIIIAIETHAGRAL